MENQLKTANPDSDEAKQRSDKTHSLDQKASSIKVQIEVEMKEGEDFPGLYWHSAVFMKNNIVLFGGKDSYRNLNNIFHIFNLETGAWSQKELKGEQESIPKPRQGHAAIAIGNFIFIIGGYREDQDKNIYKIDFDTQKCQIIGEIADPVNKPTADFHNQSIYIFGGYNWKTDEFSSMLQKFNLLTNLCKEIKLIGYQPEGRYAHMSVIVQDNLYVFGGYNYSSLDMFSINLTNNAATKIDQHGQIPSPRLTFSFFAFEYKLYLFGGCLNSQCFSDFYSFDLKSSNWESVQTKNDTCLLKRGLHSTIAVKKSSHKLKVYLIGGKESSNSICKNMSIITLTSNQMYWVLHYLDCTGIHYLPGYSLIQEIIEMFE